MSSYTGQPRVWSLWIYDRHCCLIYHADWSTFHNRASVSNTSTKSSTSGPSTLSLSEQSKLVYGVVFSLRNMTRKLSPQETSSNSNSSNSNGKSSSSTAPNTTLSSKEIFHSFSTSTYTLSHLQLSTKYTFIMITDPITPPTRRAPSSASNNSNNSSIAGGSGGGIPSTGGMSATGVLSQIARGPWIDFVVRNAACNGLERLEDDDDEIDIDEDLNDNDDTDIATQMEMLRLDRKKAAARDIEKQRLTGIGKNVDSEAFRAAVERVLSQNKLIAPRM